LRVLITGIAGFVGSNLADELLRRGHMVTGVVRATSDQWRIAGLQHKSLHLCVGDLAERSDAERVVLDARPDVIVHCAARGGYPAQSDIGDLTRSNVLAFAHLLAAAARGFCPHVINSGSSSEYGAHSAGPLEADPVHPNSVYAATKAWATWMAQRAMEEVGVTVTTLRLYSVFGRLEEPTRLMARVCAFGIMKRHAPLARPELVRDYIWIDDVVAAYVAVLEGATPRASSIYNVGSGREVRLDEVAAAAARVFGLSGQPTWGSYPARKWETERWFANAAKIRQAYGWVPCVGLEEGLERMRRWLETNVAMARRYEAATTAQAF